MMLIIYYSFFTNHLKLIEYEIDLFNIFKDNKVIFFLIKLDDTENLIDKQTVFGNNK